MRKGPRPCFPAASNTSRDCPCAGLRTRSTLLDEPLSNLDAKLRTQTGDEFRATQRRLGITTLYVTHDQAEAMALSDRVAVMELGKVLQIGSPIDVYERPKSPGRRCVFR